MSIAVNLQEVREGVLRAAERAGRQAEEITLCAVSKRKSKEEIEQAYQAGQRVFGENYVQEAVEKFSAMPQDVSLHLTGALQRNKVKHCVGVFSLIQTVDRVSLAASLDREAARNSLLQDVLLQVNIAEDENKSGVAPEAASDLCAEVLAHKNLRVRGLMTIGTWAEAGEAESVRRKEFQSLAKLRDTLSREYQIALPELSMGMSSDFQWAIEEGATIVRVGTSIFGERTH